MTVVEEIATIEMLPVVETTSPRLQGFFIKAYKRHNRKKTGFLINSIRALNIEQQGPKRVRTRITWLTEKNAFEIEEHSSLAVRRGASIVLFQVRFDDFEAEPVYMRGKPNIIKQTFKGKSVELSWGQDGIIVLKSVENKNLICKLKRKQKIIDILIEN
ncbi:MAG: hypothetical protein HeimC3_26840 [Candidatus Heimdallarchaeota archaeon LC_3]|nr:MAG: hypothetical protein HeimC3_26840 [Candidatus Heimdallarchaeota archaeon LC_3]